MDPLTLAISNLQQATVTSKIDFAVARKELESQTQSGNGALQLLDAAESGVDKAGDALVAATTGLGGQVDAYA